MQNTLILKDDLRIPDEILHAFPFYLSITHQLGDQQLISLMHNIFETKMNSLSSDQSNILCDTKIAYAVGVIFKLLLNQDTKLIDELVQMAQESNDPNLVWGLQLIQFSVYSLYKSDTQLYLNIVINNKNIPKPQLNEGQPPLTASSIYSIVLLSKMHIFFEKIQLSRRIPFQLVNDSNFQPDVDITLYQLSNAYPALVLIKYDETKLQQHIWNKHVMFLKDVLLQLLMDATSTQQSSLINKLKIQPYIVNSYEEFCQIMLVQDQDKLQQILSNQHLIKYFNQNLRSQDTTVNIKNIITTLTKDQIDIDQQRVQQQQANQLVKQQEEILELFQTAVGQQGIQKYGVSTVRFHTNAR